jgi:uncharacterized membrane protein
LAALPGGSGPSTAWAINERGEIAGEATDAVSIRRAVSWQGGTVEPLAGIDGAALDVNNRGQIVGIVTIGYQRGVLWQDRELIVLPRRVGENHVQALGINEHGVIVGATTTGRPDDPMRPTGATVWQEGNVADLNELLACRSLPESTSLVLAMDINERGEIAVQGFDSSTFGGRAFVLTPVSRRESCGP